MWFLCSFFYTERKIRDFFFNKNIYDTQKNRRLDKLHYPKYNL